MIANACHAEVDCLIWPSLRKSGGPGENSKRGLVSATYGNDISIEIDENGYKKRKNIAIARCSCKVYPLFLQSIVKMSFPYSKVLVIGATSGIGKALAAKLVQNGTQVVIAGRRKENLEEFVKEHGSGKVKSKVFDVLNLEAVSCQCYLSRPGPESMQGSADPYRRSPSLLQR